MKKIGLILCVLLTAQRLSAQEWGSINSTSVTMKQMAPAWPGCESKERSQWDKCFNTELSKHIAEQLKYPPLAYQRNEQGEVKVSFVIKKSGVVRVRSVKGGTPLLQEEARRIIEAIPRMAVPSKMGGRATSIDYTVPITFKTGK